jgi:signal transduction histidine kinase
MAVIDHISAVSGGRINPPLLDYHEAGFLEAFSSFCARLELRDLISALCRCVDHYTEFHTAFALLRPECEFGNNLPEFANLSGLDSRLNNSGFVMDIHDDGLKIFAIVRDKNGKRGRLNLALAIMPGSSTSSHAETEKLRNALEKAGKPEDKAVDLKRDSFIASLIHQVRNPLATILISASQMETKQGGELDDDDRMLVEFINREAERIEYMLSKYSHYAHAGMRESDTICASELIENIKDIISDKGYDKTRISYRFSDGLADSKIMADPNQISEGLNQVLENAFEAFESGNGSVEIGVGRDDQNITISVKDNGPGIRPELLRKVKEPFFSTKEGGSGLGLSIAEKICIAHGGGLRIESSEGNGARVTLIFPRKE